MVAQCRSGICGVSGLMGGRQGCCVEAVSAPHTPCSSPHMHMLAACRAAGWGRQKEPHCQSASCTHMGGRRCWAGDVRGLFVDSAPLAHGVHVCLGCKVNSCGGTSCKESVGKVKSGDVRAE